MIRPLATLVLLGVSSLTPTLVHAAVPVATTTTISAPDPTGDVVVDGDLEPLLGSAEVYDATDLTGVLGEVFATSYVVQATTAGALTGASDLLFLTTEVTYDLTWSTVTKRGVVAEIPENVRLTVTAEGMTVDRVSLPPRCRNDAGFSVAVSGTTITVTVPRACSKGTSGVPIGVADIRVLADGFGPAGDVASSYSDDASVDGIARLRPGTR